MELERTLTARVSTEELVTILNDALVRYHNVEMTEKELKDTEQYISRYFTELELTVEDLTQKQLKEYVEASEQ